MLVSCESMRQIEEAAFARGILPETLMAEAGLALARTVYQLTPSRPGHAIAYLGKGNNAGDAIVALRHLEEWGWTIEARLLFPPEAFSPLATKQWELIRFLIKSKAPVSAVPRRIVLLDGLVGIGAKGGLRAPLDEAAREMNQRRAAGATTVSVDIPSGLDGDTGIPADPAVVADWTVTFGYVKNGLVADTAINHVGRLAYFPLQGLEVPKAPTTLIVNSPATLRPLMQRRPFDTHKSLAGRVGIFAGSKGYTGAAVMAATGALHAGAGLITLFTEESVADTIAAAAPPEIMVRPISSIHEMMGFESISIFAVGPGLGHAFDTPLRDWIRDEVRPMVIDADALNALAHDPWLLQHVNGPRLLTPHPGEFSRLFPVAPADRLQAAHSFISCFPRTTLLLKGARTIISDPWQTSFNTTGNPGMAVGGMGDVLTGVLAGLLAQQYPMGAAARLGAWLTGRAAELAIAGGESEESLAPTHVLTHLGQAFCELRWGAV